MTRPSIITQINRAVKKHHPTLDADDAMEAIAKRIVETWSKEELAAYAVAARMDEYRDGELSAIENTLMSDLWELDGGA